MLRYIHKHSPRVNAWLSVHCPRSPNSSQAARTNACKRENSVLYVRKQGWKPKMKRSAGIGAPRSSQWPLTFTNMTSSGCSDIPSFWYSRYLLNCNRSGLYVHQPCKFDFLVIGLQSANRISEPEPSNFRCPEYGCPECGLLLLATSQTS